MTTTAAQRRAVLADMPRHKLIADLDADAARRAGRARARARALWRQTHGVSQADHEAMLKERFKRAAFTTR
ncbi:MAG: hypothetical protein ACRDXX_17545 [Stackebrandtia sp.]